jgi:hypothetical protein
MPRFEYKCICDKCKLEIQTKNDENDITFNSGRYLYCESCYQDLCAWWDCWNSDRWKIVSK